jgi:hypothetical protein
VPIAARPPLQLCPGILLPPPAVRKDCPAASRFTKVSLAAVVCQVFFGGGPPLLRRPEFTWLAKLHGDVKDLARFDGKF